MRRMDDRQPLDRNERQSIPIEEPVVRRRDAAVAAERAIKEAMPSAERLRSARSATSGCSRCRTACSSRDSASDGMRQALQTLLREAQGDPPDAGHQAARRRPCSSSPIRTIGVGRIGHRHLHRQHRAGCARPPSTASTRNGYFACYAYVNGDAGRRRDDARLVGARNGTESSMTTTARSARTRSDAWDALPAAGQGRTTSIARRSTGRCTTASSPGSRRRCR